jgi:hypothetical protein
MPRRTYTTSTRPVKGGIPWRGRHRLDHHIIPSIIQKLIDADSAGSGAPKGARPSRPERDDR